MTNHPMASGEELGALLSVYHHAGELAGLEKLAKNYSPMPLEAALDTLGRTEPKAANARARLNALQSLHRSGALRQADREVAARAAQTTVAPRHRADPNAGHRLLTSLERTGEADGQFAPPAPDMLAPEDAQAPSPLCEAVIADVKGKKATRIWARFHSDRPVADFAAGANPLNWPACNPFFIGMERQRNESKLPDPEDGYETLVLETVGYKEWGLELRTFLEVEYSATKDRVAMTFSFAGSQDGEIDVDSGYMLVYPDTNHSGKTVVESLKLVHFAKLTNQLAPFSCKLGWVQTMMNMADCRPQQPNP